MAKKTNLETSPLFGKKVPNFSLPSTSGEVFDLKAMRGTKVVLYFYPKDSTPGCTLEGQCFSKLAAQFKKHNAVVYGISRDSMKSHENFKQKQSFKIDLLSDGDEQACNLFDVIKEKNMYGKKVMGIVRSTFLIDEEGKLVKEWIGVKVDGHAEEVLAAVKQL